MADDRTRVALDRIEQSLARIEQADRDLRALAGRHARLRSEARATIAALDVIIARQASDQQDGDQEAGE